MWSRSPELRRRARGAILLGFGGIATVHAVVGHATHAEHVVHALFGAAYLVPVVAAAVWLGPRTGVLLAGASAGAALLQAWWSGEGAGMEALNALVLSGVVLLVGAVSALLVGAADREREARLDTERTAQRDAMVQALAALSAALRERDDGTSMHCARVGQLVTRMADEAGLDPASRDALRLAALVHDIGKIGVRDDVLLKPGELSADERIRIERHPTIAAELLRNVRGAEQIAELVLCHHECPDGSGYPRHLAGASIPLLARYLRVADVFAALREPRPYKREVSTVDALERMHALGGKLDEEALAVLGRALVRAPDEASQRRREELRGGRIP